MRRDAVDIIVFAPHPDDEVIGTGGVIQHALAAGKRVRVAFSTSGDGYPRAAARLAGKKVEELEPEDFIRLGETRRAEAVEADALLGLSKSDLVHLGFPDGAFTSVLGATGPTPIVAPLTGLDASPTGVPYTQAAALDAFSEVLAESGPSEVYVTNAADEHADHSATFRIVMDAMQATRSKARLLTFMVHSGHDTWPDPGPRYETKTIQGVLYPRGVAWPPPIRIPITAEEADAKHSALMKHASQWALDHAYLGTFVKSEEVFWSQ